MNTELRTKATKSFEEDSFFKLMKTSVFKKMMQNRRTRILIDLVCDNELDKLQRLIADTVFAFRKFFDGGLVVVRSKYKLKLTPTKPIYVVWSVLELLNLLMYEFYYDKIEPFYKNRVNMLYTDTDDYDHQRCIHGHCTTIFRQ